MGIVLHHLEHSRSHRILWLLEELQLEYALKTYQRDADMRAPASLREVHPLGKSPVVEIDGVVFAESGAIVEELVDRTGRLRPEAGTDEHRRYRFYMHYAEGSLMPPMLVGLITGLLKGNKVPWIVRPIAKGIAKQIDGSYTDGEVERHTAFLEGELAEREYLCGSELTAADIQMSYPVEALLRRGVQAPKLAAYHARLAARPAFAKAVETGGTVMPPYRR